MMDLPQRKEKTNLPQSFRLTIFNRKRDPLLQVKENLTNKDIIAEGTLALKRLSEGKIGGFALTEEFAPLN